MRDSILDGKNTAQRIEEQLVKMRKETQEAVRKTEENARRSYRLTKLVMITSVASIVVQIILWLLSRL